MDFTKITCISSSCKDKSIIMESAGGSIMSDLIAMKVKCPECNLTLLLIPLKDNKIYNINVTNKP